MCCDALSNCCAETKTPATIVPNENKPSTGDTKQHPIDRVKQTEKYIEPTKHFLLLFGSTVTHIHNYKGLYTVEWGNIDHFFQIFYEYSLS